MTLCAILSKSPERPLCTARRGRYVIDPMHTRVLFSVSHFGFSIYYGEFVHPQGTLDLASEAPGAGALEVWVPVANVSTSNSALDDELRGRSWLDAERFPKVALASTSPISLASRQFRVTGDLSLCGLTRSLTFDVTFVGAGINPKKQIFTIGFDIRAKLRRSDYGVMSELPHIGDEVSLMISAAFELESEAA